MNKFVTSLPLSKKLFEAGAKQSSEFYRSAQTGEIITSDRYYDFQDHADTVGLPEGSEIEKFYSTFLTDEILERLPIPKESSLGNINVSRYKHGNWEIYWTMFDSHTVINKSLVEASGEMYLWCLENKYL